MLRLLMVIIAFFVCIGQADALACGADERLVVVRIVGKTATELEHCAAPRGNDFVEARFEQSGFSFTYTGDTTTTVSSLDVKSSGYEGTITGQHTFDSACVFFLVVLPGEALSENLLRDIRQAGHKRCPVPDQ